MNHEQKEKAKHIRLTLEKILKKELDELLDKHSNQLSQELKDNDCLPVSYLDNGESDWSVEDSKGFVNNFLIERLIKQDPSEDFDGYNRWDIFENLSEETFL